MVRPCVMVPMGVRVSLEAKMPLEVMVLLKDESTPCGAGRLGV